MDCFIKKLFEGNKDDLIHQQFQKFSKGKFENRAMIRVKNSGGKYTLTSSAEYAKELIMNFAEKLGDEKTRVTGALISALDLDGFEYKEKKSAIGVRKYIINSEMSGNEILELCGKVTKAFFGLSFNVGEEELKIKDKSPKSAKGSGSTKKEGEKAKIDFCKLKTKDTELIKKFVFDSEAEKFKNVEISHDFIIDDIVISDELKTECENDFAKLREMAVRKGRVVRKMVVDGKEIIKEIVFEA